MTRRIIATALILLSLSFFIAAQAGYPSAHAPGHQEDEYPCNDRGFWRFLRDVRTEWVYENDFQGEITQYPIRSFDRLRGDCEDFAIMIAYYSQEYWGYDSFVQSVHMVDSDTNHMVAFIHCSREAFDSITSQCPGEYPYLSYDDGSLYLPFDWDICPDWTWTSCGSSNARCYEWYELLNQRI